MQILLLHIFLEHKILSVSKILVMHFQQIFIKINIGSLVQVLQIQNKLIIIIIHIKHNNFFVNYSQHGFK